MDDLARQRIVLQDGLRLTLYSEEIEADGVVQYSTDEHVWIAAIDWQAVRDTSSVPLVTGQESL